MMPVVSPVGRLIYAAGACSTQIALGGPSIVIRKFEPDSLLRTIEKEKATIISGAPALYNILLQHPKAHRYDTRSIIKCTSGSDKLPLEIKIRLPYLRN